MILGAGRAAGKVILFGEHAVVYGRPALAVPVTQVWAEATVAPAPAGAGLTILAADLGEAVALRAAPADHPLAAAARLALAAIRSQEAGSRAQGAVNSFQFPASSSWLAPEPDWLITIRSTIPIASGLGSGAAVSAAIVRAVFAAAKAAQLSGIEASAGHAQHLERPANAATPQEVDSSPAPPPLCSSADVSALVYEVERLHHGTPSGVDNTVIAYEQPVYFVRGQPPQRFAIGQPFTLIIADTGIRSPTRLSVGDVRGAWERDPARFEALFDRVAVLVAAARAAIAAGKPQQLGPLMDDNHALLRAIGVSCPELDALVAAARSAGALGAKLSGGGRGGNMIALVTGETAQPVADALAAAGATRVIVTEVATKGE